MYDLEPWKAPRPAATPAVDAPATPAAPTETPAPPAAAATPPAGVRLHFRDDYDREHGLKDGQPGDCFYVPCGAFKSPTNEIPPGCPNWDNCDGRHLYVICPDGRWWNVDGRAGNCSMKDDRQHRCWIRTGSPEDGTLSVGKAGPTCAAGAGSIDTGTYHGMLTAGAFNP